MSSLTRMSSSCPGSSSSSFHSADENWQSRPSSRHSSRPPSEPSENGGQGPAASSRSELFVEPLDRMQHQSPAWMTSKQPGHAADRTPQVDGVPIARHTHNTDLFGAAASRRPNTAASQQTTSSLARQDSENKDIGAASTRRRNPNLASLLREDSAKSSDSFTSAQSGRAPRSSDSFHTNRSSHGITAASSGDEAGVWSDGGDKWLSDMGDKHGPLRDDMQPRTIRPSRGSLDTVNDDSSMSIASQRDSSSASGSTAGTQFTCFTGAKLPKH
jgi:hypothetical protein